MIWNWMIYAKCVESNEYIKPIIRDPIGNEDRKGATQLKSCPAIKSNAFKLNEDGFEFVGNLLEGEDKIFNNRDIENFTKDFDRKTYQKYGRKVEKLIKSRSGLKVFCHTNFIFRNNGHELFHILHKDRVRASVIKLDNKFGNYKESNVLSETELGILNEFLEKEQVVDNINLWLNIGQIIKHFPLAFVPKQQSEQCPISEFSAYYFKEMKFGDALIFDGHIYHGALHRETIGDNQRISSTPLRTAISFICVKLPNHIMEIIQKLKTSHTYWNSFKRKLKLKFSPE
eukprot:NODE_774_length_3980_cov_0.719402.p3 type:complete len:286 gc:universal NODE_774_length_3980_cov_0.719402:1214-2071(+)